MDSKPAPGSNAFLKSAGSSLVEPIALSLSEAVGGLKFMAKVAEKAKQIVIEKKIFLILLNQQKLPQDT
jgi:hypothetical protein